MRKAAFAIIALAAACVVGVVAVWGQDAPVSLLESVPVVGEVGGEGSPLQLYYSPQQQAQLAQQQPLMRGPVPQQSAVRYVYVPGTAMINTPYGQRYIRYYKPEAVVEGPGGVQQLAQQAPPAKVPTAAAISARRAKEITALRKALNSAEMHEKNYEKKVVDLQHKSVSAVQQAQIAQRGMVTAAKLGKWSKMEQAAALRLKRVEAMAEAKVAKQKAAVDKLLPIVREEVSRRRVLENRLAKAAANARMSSQQEMLERQRLMVDMQIAQEAEQHAHVAQLSYQTMQKRAEQMSKEAAEDRVQAKKDIQEARASVLGARNSAAKTLAAIRASMGKGKGNTVASDVDETKFATAARDATKEMSSKKRDAKALRQEARQLDSESRSLSTTAGQWQAQIPSALAKAKATQQQAEHLRLILKNTVQSAEPFNNKVNNAEELTQLSHVHAKQLIRKLAKSQQEHQQASALLARVHSVASAEEIKAERDAILARRRMKLAVDRLQKAKSDHEEYEKKIVGLKSVLASSKQELAELETEAHDIDRNGE